MTTNIAPRYSAPLGQQAPNVTLSLHNSNGTDTDLVGLWFTNINVATQNATAHALITACTPPDYKGVFVSNNSSAWTKPLNKVDVTFAVLPDGSNLEAFMFIGSGDTDGRIDCFAQKGQPALQDTINDRWVDGKPVGTALPSAPATSTTAPIQPSSTSHAGRRRQPSVLSLAAAALLASALVLGHVHL